MTDNTHPATPPPLQTLPTAKERKYDRQLRLWGATGQRSLEGSRILLINSGTGVTGVETLKNLILPGVGHFTILDSHIVTEADLGLNFFLEEDSVGKFRAIETIKFLNELNPEVTSNAITTPIEQFVQTADILQSYSFVLIAAPIDPAILSQLSTYLNDRHIPLIYFHSVGFYSQFSLQLPPTHPIVDTHPDPTAAESLMLLRPWPELVAYTEQMTSDWAGMSQIQKTHLPYICILLRLLEIWKQEHGGEAPTSYKDKTAFRKLVLEEGGDEENYQEAYNAVLKALNPPSVPSDVRAILEAPETIDLGPKTASFWYIARAVKIFYDKHGVLPLPGSIPDMKSQPDDYVRLQKIYKEKARSDAAEVLATLRTLEHNKGAIEASEVDNFCKGASHIHLIRGRPIQVVQAGEKIKFADRATALASRLGDPDSLLSLYIAFLAYDEFAASHPPVDTHAAGHDAATARVPGQRDAELESDEYKLTGIAHKIFDGLLNEAGTTIDDPEYTELKDALGSVCVEIARAGGAELHNIASLTGGTISQEVLKVITAQYVPVDNTCLFDGILSKSSVLRV